MEACIDEVIALDQATIGDSGMVAAVQHLTDGVGVHGSVTAPSEASQG